MVKKERLFYIYLHISKNICNFAAQNVGFAGFIYAVSVFTEGIEGSLHIEIGVIDALL